MSQVHPAIEAQSSSVVQFPSILGTHHPLSQTFNPVPVMSSTSQSSAVTQGTMQNSTTSLHSSQSTWSQMSCSVALQKRFSGLSTSIIAITPSAISDGIIPEMSSKSCAEVVAMRRPKCTVCNMFALISRKDAVGNNGDHKAKTLFRKSCSNVFL